MKPTITKEKLEEIRKRAEAATGGKWVAEVNDGLMDHRTYYRVFSDIETEYSEVTFLVHKLENEEDADFIANARQDIPALLDHIADLETFISRICPIGDLSVVDSLLAEKNHMAEEISKLQGKIDLYESYAQEYDYYAILNEMGDEDDNV